MTPQDVIEEARDWIGTPWHHSASVKGVGTDCAGLLAGVSRALGVDVEYSPNYTLGDEFERMTGIIEAYCDLLPEGTSMQDGDILVFRGRMMTNHCGFVTESGTLIHAYNSPSIGRVVEQPLTEEWQARMVRHYRYKGLL